MLESQDKRQFMRMAINTSVKGVLTGNEGDKPFEATCLDLSAEGLSLALPVSAQVGDRVFIEIPASGTRIAPLSVKTVVVRSEPSNDNPGHCIIGCRITEMS